MKSRKEFGQFLREKREAANVTQRDLAAKLGWSTSQFVSNLERGICSFPMESAKKYCREINLKPQSFLSARAEIVIADQKRLFFKGKN